jgi:hypothetical protein
MKDSIGIVNQLRGYTNSKPTKKLHPYIITLLEQPWIAQIVRPSWKPEKTFYLKDLTEAERAYLEEKNPFLFDTTAFFEEFKNLNYPTYLRDQLIERIEFPTSYVLEVLADIPHREFEYPQGFEAKIATAAIKRAAQKAPSELNDELIQLMQTARNMMLQTETPGLIRKFRGLGVELPTTEILRIFNDILADQPVSQELWLTACDTLKKKIERQDDDIGPLLNIARQILLNKEVRELISAGVALTQEQTQQILQDFIDVTKGLRPTAPPKFLWNTIIESIKHYKKRSENFDQLIPLLKYLMLHPDTPYEFVSNLVNLGINLTEEEIIDVLSHPRIVTGRCHAALVSLQNKIEAGSRRLMRGMIKTAQEFMLRTREERLIEEAFEIVELPIKDIIKVISAKRYNLMIRQLAIKSLKQRNNRGNKYMRNKAFEAVKGLLLRTKTKGLIEQLLNVFEGHQKQYSLFYSFVTHRIDWLSLERNQSFFVSLMQNSLPRSKSAGFHHRSMPGPLYRLFKKLIKEDMTENSCDIIIKMLFNVKFDQESMPLIRSLLETIIDAIIADPKKLTHSLCQWYQAVPGGWGSTEHRSFDNKIPMSRKLKKQFIKLAEITFETGNDCYLDLAVTIAEQMESGDRQQLIGLANAMVRDALTTKRWRYEHSDILKRLLNLH